MEENQLHIPDGWENIVFGDVIETLKNGFSGNQVDYITDFPVTRIETISNGNIDFNKVGFVQKIPITYSLKNGDILLSNINSVKHIGKIAYFYSDKVLFHGMNLLLLRFSQEIDSKFIYYYLLTRKKWFEKEATQAINQASINQTTLQKYLWLNIPKSKTEQTSIARVLSKVDEAIAQTEQLIAKYTRIKTGLMQDLLTKGIDENGNIRSEQTHEFKDSPLGRIPKEWECELLGENNIELHNNKRKPISSKERANMIGDYPYYGATGIIDRLNVYKVDGEFVLFGEDGDHFLKWVYQEQTILTYGKFNVSNHAHIVKGTSKCSTKWIHYFFCHRDITYYLTRQGAGRFKLNKASLLTLPILIPKSKAEQESIIQRIEKVNEYSDDLSSKLSKLQSLKTGLMQDLLSGKARVNHLIKETASV